MNQPDITTKRGLTIALCFFVTLLEGFDIQALGISLGKLRAQFGLDASQVKWLATLSSAGIVLGAIVGGRMADYFGRKPILLVAVVIFGLFTVGMIEAPNYSLLLSFRILAGAGFGAALPIMMAVSAEISKPSRKAITAAMVFSGMPAGGGTSALLAQLLGSGFDWRILFAVGGLLPLLLVPAIYFMLPETSARKVATSSPVANVAQALFGEKRVVPTLLLWLTFFPTMLILYLILNWLPTLVGSKGFGGTIPSEAAVWFNYGAVVGALLFGRLVDRFGTRGPLIVSYGALIVCLSGLGQAVTASATLWLSALTGLVLLGANYAMYGIAATYYATRIRGTGSGATVSVGRVGAIAGPLLAGQWLQQGSSATQVIGYMVPFAIVAALAVFMLSFYKPTQE
jgi:AAHS family 3-hydroxyphenylpropionic acid transporter